MPCGLSAYVFWDFGSGPLRTVNWGLFRKVEGLEIMTFKERQGMQKKVSTEEHICLPRF